MSEIISPHKEMGCNARYAVDRVMSLITFSGITPGVSGIEILEVESIIAGIELKWYNNLFRAMPCLVALTPGISAK